MTSPVESVGIALAGADAVLRLPAAPPPHRLDRARAWLDAQGVDALVASDPATVVWLAGYHRYLGGPSAVVLASDGTRTLFVMRDEVAVAERLARTERVAGFGERGFGLELDPLPLLAREVAALGEVATASRVALTGVLGPALAECCPAEQVEAGSAMRALSMVKDLDEVQAITHAYELCWAGHGAVAEGTASGASEIEMLSAAQSAAQVAHGGPVGFVADLLAGENTGGVCAPTVVAGPTRPGTGEAVVADISVGADGYWGDTCRTYIRGANQTVEDMRTRLVEIRSAAARALRPGATGASVYGQIHEQIRADWPDGEFPHHGGHAVGLSPFEDPHVIPAEAGRLETWMVLALEPGVYFPGRFGVRTESLYLVTPDGGVELCEVMGRGGPPPN